MDLFSCKQTSIDNVSRQAKTFEETVKPISLQKRGLLINEPLTTNLGNARDAISRSNYQVEAISQSGSLQCLSH